MSTPRLEIRTLTPGRDAVVDRWLARVARLGPAEWGRLDAIGQRFVAGDPMSRWQRAARLSAAGAAVPALPALQQALAVVGFGVELVRDLTGGTHDGPRRPRDAPPSADPRTRRRVAQVQSLWDLGHAQPGGGGAAMSCLMLGLAALHARPLLPADAFARLYALVEPVIPVVDVEP
ncbi:hypothetical protein [Roseisolibacter agri]|uniref:Uncharacterized protein n=1 Tax=Roseisolibacter agri TaxID=2014610 RepID=A0AA37V524_9BACT|nr:hypothetical protein [Roseisolibacter agri]GLC23561.1 hypothetical protein rosag_00740 [Roseisolibacter agri]